METINSLRRYTTVLALMLFIIIGRAADPLDTWTWRNPLPTGNSLQAVVYGGGQFVAVGFNGAILNSTDGANWIQSESGTTNELDSIAYGNGTFVAVSTTCDVTCFGTLLSSTNGVNWVGHQLGADHYLSSITFGNGEFVAIDIDSAIALTSVDGNTWVPHDLPKGNFLESITYGNGQFVAVGVNGLIASSPDGVNWTLRDSGTSNDLPAIAFGNGQFVVPTWAPGAPPSILTSTDAVTWVSRWSGMDYSFLQFIGVGFGNGLWVAVGAGTEVGGADELLILTSSDGVEWSQRPSRAGNGFLSAVAYGNGQYVAVGSAGTILTSSDGLAWVSRSGDTTEDLNGLAYGNGQFVAVSFGEEGFGSAIVRFADGASPIQRQSGYRPVGAIAYGNGRFVAMGGTTATGGNAPILTSSDGVSWVRLQPGTDGQFAAAAVARGNGQFVAVGYPGTIVTSADGVHWVPRQSGVTNSLGAIAYGNGQFVAVGYLGTIVTSADGVHWVPRQSGTTNGLGPIAYGNGQFVALANNWDGNNPTTTLVISGDGENWIPQQSVTLNSVLWQIAYGNGQFVAVGFKSNGYGGIESDVIASSADGVNWVQRKSITDNQLYAVAYGNNHFVAVGQNGTILESGQLGPGTGPPGLWIDAAFTNVASGYTVAFTAVNTGPVQKSFWDFGDGTLVTNQAFVHHAWSVPGVYTVRLTGSNDSFPAEAIATVVVTVSLGVCYVDAASASPVFPFGSWATAATTIQDAIGVGGAAGRLVLVTNGVYRVGTVAGSSGLSRVSLTNYVVVRSVNGPSVTVIEGATNGVRCAYVENGSLLSGFTLTKGTATNYWTGGGASSDSLGVLTNCTLADNSSTYDGGGASLITLYNCVLTNNASGNNGGGADSSTLYNCVLAGNSAPSAGGWGGGASFSTLYNCLLTGNSAGQYGGGAFADTLDNCTLSGNSATSEGGGVYGDTNYLGSLYDCIVYSNQAPQGANYSGCSFSYSCAAPQPQGPGNIESDPLFVNAAAGDFHLRYGSPCIDTGTNLVAGSVIGRQLYWKGDPIVYTLTEPTDLDGRPRPLDGTGGGISAFDMGCYEFDRLSVFPGFSPVQQTPGGLLLQWNEAATGFKLQRTGNLASPNWQDVPGSQTVNTLTLPLGNGTEFFRLVKP